MRRSLITFFVTAAAAASIVAACGPDDNDTEIDASTGAGLDGGARLDAGHDAGGDQDAGTDAGADGGTLVDAGTSDAGHDAGVDGGGTRAVSFAHDLQPLFDAKCVSCHSTPSDGGTAAGHLDLTASKSFGQLVDVNTNNADCSFLKRVRPGLAVNSFLWLKVTGQQGQCGASMPQGSTLPSAEARLIDSWISAGAPNN